MRTKKVVCYFILTFLLLLAACAPPAVETASPTEQIDEPAPTEAAAAEEPVEEETPMASEEPMDEGGSDTGEGPTGDLITAPEQLIGTWSGIPGGGWMVFRPDGSFRGSFDGRELFNTRPGDNAFWNGVYRFEDGQIIFNENSNRGCDDSQDGVYRAYLDGEALKFVLVSDTCDTRTNTLLGQRVEPVIDIVWEQTSTDAHYPLGWTRTIELPFVPHDIAVAPDGSIYAVELGVAMVHKLDQEGNVITSWGSEGSEPGQFAFSPPPDAPPLDGGFVTIGADNRVYISDSYNNRVQIFDQDGNFITMWTSLGEENTPFNNPGPISADDAGNIYVGDFAGVHQFDADGNYMTTIMAGGEVAFDSAGNLYATVAFEGFVIKVPAGGGEPEIWGSAGTEHGQFDTPIWVVVTQDDEVFVSDHTGRVQKFDSEGNFMAVWSDPANGDGPLMTASSISLGPDGDIYVAPKDRSTIYVLNP